MRPAPRERYVGLERARPRRRSRPARRQVDRSLAPRSRNAQFHGVRAQRRARLRDRGRRGPARAKRSWPGAKPRNGSNGFLGAFVVRGQRRAWHDSTRPRATRQSTRMAAHEHRRGDGRPHRYGRTAHRSFDEFARCLAVGRVRTAACERGTIGARRCAWPAGRLRTGVRRRLARRRRTRAFANGVRNERVPIRSVECGIAAHRLRVRVAVPCRGRPGIARARRRSRLSRCVDRGRASFKRRNGQPSRLRSPPAGRENARIGLAFLRSLGASNRGYR